MTKEFWTEFFLKYDRYMYGSDPTWDEQKQWMRDYLNKRCKVKSGVDIPIVGTTDNIDVQLVCCRCFARYGVGTIHNCQVKK